MENDSKANPPNPEQKTQGTPSGLSSLWAELRRRKVIRVAAVYAVVAWLVIQIAVATFPSLYIPQWALSFVVMCVILGFPVALIVAWAFELTPEGIKTSKTAQEEHPEAHKDEAHTKKRNWYALAFAAAAPTLIFGSLALFFYLRAGDEPLLTEEDKSIAVLPFENRSSIEEDQYFTDGIHDDLLTHISRIRDIKTISRTSVMGYRSTTKGMPVIGEELGVSHILEGGVQRAGKQIRINVQLINAAADKHVWAEIYTREMTAEDIFTIQNEIATVIATKLKAVLSPEEKKQLEQMPTQNLQAMEAYFEGKVRSQKSTSKGLQAAIPYFEKAIEIDPSFATAYAALANVHLLRIYFGGLEPEAQSAKAKPLIERAIELNPNLSEAYVARGQILAFSNDAKAEAAFEKAIELGPNNANAFAMYSNYSQHHQWDLPKAISLARKAVKVNPKAAGPKANLAEALMQARQRDEAKTIMEALVMEAPEYSNYLGILASIYHQNFHQYDLAIRTYRKAYSIDSDIAWRSFHIAFVYDFLGDFQSENFWMERFFEKSPDPLAVLIKGQYLCSLNRIEEALDIFRRIPSDHPAFRTALAHRAIYEPDPEERRRILTQTDDLWQEDMGLDKDGSSRDLQFLDVLTRAESKRVNGLDDQAKEIARVAIEALPSETLARWQIIDIVVTSYAMAGDISKALKELEAYVDLEGAISFSEKSYTPIPAAFDILKDEPRFVELKAIMDKRLAAQRANLARWEAEGELAPIPDLPAN